MDYKSIPSPCYVIDELSLRENLQKLKSFSEQADVKIILAFKGFSTWGVFPVVREYFTEATASSLHEAMLCREEMGSAPHTYCVAIHPDEAEELISMSRHIVFNSTTEVERYRYLAEKHGVPYGLRINPEYSEVETDLYNPASPVSRLGVTQAQLKNNLPKGISGLHFHTLCENNSYTLEKTLEALEKNFSEQLRQVEWLNIGGGHLITHKDYDINHAVHVLKRFKEKFDLEIIMEPGSAFAWQTGFLYAKVLDIVENGGVKTANLNVSFTAHMPDCLEMPYTPVVRGARISNDPSKNNVYRLGGNSCLAGDFMEAYEFDEPLEAGDSIIFEDMIHYTMVKTTTFNGVRHPSIGVWTKDGSFRLIRSFGYENYKNRLS